MVALATMLWSSQFPVAQAAARSHIRTRSEAMNDAQVPTRRNFLKSSAGAAAGAAFAGAMLSTPSVYAQADETIKIGLIGCGGRGTGAAGQTDLDRLVCLCIHGRRDDQD